MFPPFQHIFFPDKCLLPIPNITESVIDRSLMVFKAAYPLSLLSHWLLGSNKSMCLNMNATEGDPALLVTIKYRKKNIHNPAYMLSHIYFLQKTGLLSNLFIRAVELVQKRLFSAEQGEPPVLHLYSAAIEMSAYALENRNTATDVATVSTIGANQTSNIDIEKLLMLKQTIVYHTRHKCWKLVLFQPHMAAD